MFALFSRDLRRRGSADVQQVRNMKDFDINGLIVNTYDGKNADPKYAEPWDKA